MSTFILLPRNSTDRFRYNYVLASAFPTGIAVTAIIIFFALQIPKGGLELNWWGNEIVNAGCDGNGGCPLYDTLPDVGYFGPAKGTFT